ncbi:MAG: type II secretion system protein [Thiobacillus sp.]
MKKQNKGFTLIEVLLVVAIIAILAGIVIIAVNPAKQMADTRNSQRRMDVKTISDAVYQYANDKGSIPATITDTPTDVCTKEATDGGSCSGINLSVLTDSGQYVVSIPKDPSTATANSTKYQISKDVNSRVVVAAPSAENGVTISVTR